MLSGDRHTRVVQINKWHSIYVYIMQRSEELFFLVGNIFINPRKRQNDINQFIIS